MGKLGYHMIIIGMVIVSIAPYIDATGNDTDFAPVRGGLDDPVVLELLNFDTYLYPGESDTFYIRLYNHYDGSSFGGPSTPVNVTEIKEVKIFISGFYDEFGEPVPTSPVNWITGSLYNNDGDGYTVPGGGYVNFYADSANSYLEYRIRTDGIMTGRYNIGFRVEFMYMVDWDGGSQFGWESSSVVELRSFQISSYVTGSYYPEYRFCAYSEDLGTDTLYAGATNKLIGMYNLYSAIGTVTDVTATLSFPGIGITVREPSVFNPSLPGRIYWRVDVPADIPPGVYDVHVTLSYSHSGFLVNEQPTLHELIVEYTPLLESPMSDDPYLTFSRADLPSSVTVPFTNTGNVDLHGITVNIDLDNTMYVDGARYYLNEENSGTVTEEDLDVFIGNVTKGESRSVTFEGLTFLPRLPPGLYKIPLDYSGFYFDDGSTGGASMDVQTGHWSDRGVYRHRDIMRDMAYPEDKNSQFRQYLLIEILEDPAGPLLNGNIDSGFNQYPGTVNARMRLRVETLEMYQMKNIIYHIHTDEGSPFLRPFSSGNDTHEGTLEPVLRAGLSASSGTYTQSDNFYFYANIKENAPPGINYFRVDVEGYTEFNQPFATTFLGYITLRSHQPRFEMVSVDTGDVLGDRSVEVNVNMINLGLGGAWNLTCFFKSSSSGFIGTDAPLEVGNVEKNSPVTYTFHLKPDGGRRYYGGTYTGNIYFSYYDDMGEFNELMSGSNLYVRFDIFDHLPDLIVVDVDAPLVDMGDEFDVTVILMNAGGSATNGLKVILPYSSSQFNIEDPEKELTDIGPGESVEITFTIKAEKEISPRTTYSFNMRFSYTDIMGRERTYGDGESESFNVRTKDHIYSSEQRQIVEDDGVWISEGAGNVILGIFILIAMVIFGIIMTGGRITGDSPKVKKPSAKILIEDDEEEEEEGEEEEEMDW